MDNAPQADPKKLFVGNLSFGTTKETVESVFSEYGEVTDVFMLTDKVTRRPRGIAFVTFAEESQAQAAIEGLNGKELEGRDLIVNVSRPPRPRSGGFRPHGGGRDHRNGGYGRDDRR